MCFIGIYYDGKLNDSSRNLTIVGYCVLYDYCFFLEKKRAGVFFIITRGNGKKSKKFSYFNVLQQEYFPFFFLIRSNWQPNFSFIYYFF